MQSAWAKSLPCLPILLNTQGSNKHLRISSLPLPGVARHQWLWDDHTVTTWDFDRIQFQETQCFKRIQVEVMQICKNRLHQQQQQTICTFMANTLPNLPVQLIFFQCKTLANSLPLKWFCLLVSSGSHKLFLASLLSVVSAQLELNARAWYRKNQTNHKTPQGVKQTWTSVLCVRHVLRSVCP